MKIPALPQVEFDEFPTNDETRICIFTKLKYPVPDLSNVLSSGRKLNIFCTESAFLTMGRFAKRLPTGLFKSLPTGINWLKFDSSWVDGLNTPFSIACLPTGSVSDSVMLLILLLNDSEKPKGLSLYTGSFTECRDVLMSNLFLQYKNKITDVYFDNTMAGSLHLDSIQSAQACSEIKCIIDRYPEYKIRLQMDVFGSLDLLVDLARCHRINIKLNLLQQIFFYKSQFKHLFQYDAEIPKANVLNQNFPFKNRPSITVILNETFDAATYKRYFQEQKIINIRLIASEIPFDAHKNGCEGLFYIQYAGHAGALTLRQLFHEIRSERIRLHPFHGNELNSDPMLEIPSDILNERCEIVNNSEFDERMPDVTLDETRSKPMQRSFLAETSLVSASEMFLFMPNENDNMEVKDDVISISDDDSVTVEAMVKMPGENNGRKAKQLQSKDAELPHKHPHEPVQFDEEEEQNDQISTSEDEDEHFQSNYNRIVFPDDL